ncbi:RHS repeat-associated core domain-containing protein [Pseudomonas migulae]|uniref:RHS repeat-associated core domain-containing protein n=1 Tax=Pseudomonas migulae TaxID=78543 RepID=UPI003714F917
MSARLHRKTPAIQAFDSRGLPVRQIAYWRDNAEDNPQLRITRQQHDVAGRQVAQWDPRLFASVQDANLRTIHSLSGKALRVDSVDAGWRLDLHGDAGQRLRSWDQRGSHWQTTYDDQLRPTVIREQTGDETLRVIERLGYGDSSSESARHNLCGALTRHDDAAGTLLTPEYALCGKPARQTRHYLNDTQQPDWPDDKKDRDALLETGDGHETNWDYDALGATIRQVDAGQHQRRFSFDRAGQLKTIGLLVKGSATEQVILKDLHYNAFGQIESQTAGNGVVSRAGYDPARGRLTSLQASVSGSALQDLLYTYDAVGNVTRIEDKAQPVQFGSNQRVDAVSTFTYDSLYQLTRATGREAQTRISQPLSSRTPIDARQLFNFTEHYAYDLGGNLTELRHVRDRNNYTRTFSVANASNRLQSWNKGDSSRPSTATFDANGNQQALNPGQTLEWNARNQLASVLLIPRDDGRNDVERYSYDSSGQRVRKVQTTYAASVTHTRETRYLPGLEIRTRHNERLEVITLQAGRCSVRYLHWTEGRPAGIAGNQLRYSLDDHLGSSSLELDDQAWLISQESYLPYGGTAWSASRSEVEADYRTVRYSGKERDTSGLYCYGQRYYAPWLQRWVSPDPAGPVDGLNLYAMVGNNPVSFFDHQGLGKVEAVTFDHVLEPDPWALEIVQTSAAASISRNRNRLAAGAYGDNPANGLSKNRLKELVVHSYANFWEEDKVIGRASGFYNLNGPRSGPTGYQGVDHDYAGTAQSPDFYLNFGSYKIGNTAEYMTDLANRYSAAKDDPVHRINVSLSLREQSPTINRTAANVHELQQWTRDSIEKHIEESNGIIPKRAGGPGAHGEVRLLNTIVALYPDKAERMLSEATVSTSKLFGDDAVKPFIACFNCSGIIPETTQIWTRRNRKDYAGYNAHIQQINGTRQ